ncbi:hypothetical protein [Cellulosimicrobium cellulans]|uniref:hypothetical protein n=1 Tax=Cellulosimicrobium cellulans TaxID=1710 RepID=UPI00240771DD|nr:hypothetical protein [Cellulosimicrobium cellulans]MDF9877004.1 hypothetical protein [Cellulosimicrobium cellulans]
MSRRVVLVSMVFSVVALSGCVISPPMVETDPSPTPGECAAAFESLVGATVADRDALVTATLDECSLEAWHQQNATLQPDLPVERVSDPQEQLAKLCADERWESTRVCEEAAAQS